jgi:hypothetical protein
LIHRVWGKRRKEEFFGGKAPGMKFVGKKSPGMEFLGKNQGIQFVGKLSSKDNKIQFSSFTKKIPIIN